LRFESFLGGTISFVCQNTIVPSSPPHTHTHTHTRRAISESEPGDTYLKTASSDLARTCNTMETSHGDSEDTLLVHNLQSIAYYVRASLVNMSQH
jgi:hypothetical protein